MSERTTPFPETLAIEPLCRPPVATVRVPGSKSITNRALVLAALAEPGPGSVLTGALRSEDTEVMADALRALGFHLDAEWDRGIVHVSRGPSASPVPAAEADLFVGNSGTSMRFLTALVSLGRGRYRLDGVPRMRERPIGDLLDALRQFGVRVACEEREGYPPVVVEADGLAGGRARVRGNVSSQFLSGLLMAAPLARGEVTVEVDGPLVSAPYVAMTVRMMRDFGADVVADGDRSFRVAPRPGYRARTYAVEPDATAASYFLGAAAITGGRVTVAGLGAKGLQGDVRFVDILEAMGCRLVRDEAGLTVCGGPLRGALVDMNAISDCVMTLAAVACFADGSTAIRNVAHIRHKETDRIGALANELRRLGAGVEELPDGLRITPRPLHGATVETYRDHRMAMSLALVGLRVPGVVLRDPGCVAKTYPGFFEDLERLRGSAGQEPRA
jgi:3-phosphoshikimate 1-carboxyvinyltransferase